MRIRLIQPAQLDEQGNVVKFRKLFFPTLTLPTIAALTPEHVDVGITSEYVSDIDFDEDVDLVGITALTCQAPRAYQVAAEFRRRGRKVVMGGIHVSACPEEAAKHVDSLVLGEAEPVWEQVIADTAAGCLKPLYKAHSKPKLQELAVPRYDLVDYSRYVLPPFAKTPLIPIQTARGCPHNCSFCTVTEFWGPQIRTKPVANVLREIETIQPSRIFFADDNIGADPAHARELFEALTPLRIRWACQMSVTIGAHPGLIEAAAAGGCHETYVGMESLNQESLKSVGKGFNKVDKFRDLFKRMADAGILAQAAIVIGLDEDTPDQLRRAIDTVVDWDINYLYVTILTPLPGSRLYRQLVDEERITCDDWSLYDFSRANFRPRKMTPEQLEELIWEMYEKFYSGREIARRFWRFKRQYVRYFPRDNAVEELYFQVHLRNAVRRKTFPFTLGLTE